MMGAKRILIAEDERIVAADISDSLKMLGYEVVASVASGEKALAMIGETKPDIVLMDIILKGRLSGITAASRIRETFGIPVVYLTAHADENTLEKAKRTEPYGYIVKPFVERELRSTIEMALYKHMMEGKLRESEKRYRGLFEGVPVGLSITAPDGEVIDANPTLTRMLGYPDLDALKKRNARDVYSNPADREKWQAVMERKGTVERFETQFLKWDGTGIWIELNSRAVSDENGNILCYEGSMTDITERKLAEEEMRRRLMKFELEDGAVYLVVENTPVQSMEAFKDILRVGYRGLVIARARESGFRRSLDSDFDYLWLSEKPHEKAQLPVPDEIEEIISGLPQRSVVLMDRLDYLITKNGFKEILSFVQLLTETAYINNIVVILSISPRTLGKREMAHLEMETQQLKMRYIAKLPKDLFGIIRFVFEENAIGRKPSHSDLRREIGVSKPTMTKRLRKLISTGYLTEHESGSRKVLELTRKGRNLFLK